MDAEAIGKRITDARTKCGLSSTAKLAVALGKLLGQKEGEARKGKGKSGITRQTIDNWEGGQIPPWDRVELLAEVFASLGRSEFNEEWILFGKRRAAQLAAEQPVLEHVSPEEWQLLQEYRHATEGGRKAILASARGIRESNPLPLAQVRAIGHRTA